MTTAPLNIQPCIDNGYQSAECAAALEGQCGFASLQPDPVSGSTISRSVLLDPRSPCFNFYRDVLARGDAAAEAKVTLTQAIREYCTGDGRDAVECDCANFNTNYADFCDANACTHATLSSTEPLFPMCWVSTLYFHNACGGATSGEDDKGIPCNADGGSQSIIEFTSCAAGGKNHTKGNTTGGTTTSSTAAVEGAGTADAGDDDGADSGRGCGAVCNPHVCWYQPCLGSTYANLLTPDMYDFIADNRCASVCFQSIAQRTIAVGSTPLPGEAWKIGQSVVNCGGVKATGAKLVTLLPPDEPTWVIKWSKNAQTTASLQLYNSGDAVANWTAAISGFPDGMVALAAAQGTFPPGATLPLYLEANQATIAALDDNSQHRGTITLTYLQDPTAPTTAQQLTLTIPVTIDVLADQPVIIETEYTEVPGLVQETWTWAIVAIVAMLAAGLLLIFLLRSWGRGQPPKDTHHHAHHQNQTV